MKNVFGYDPKTKALDGEIFVKQKLEGEIVKKREEFENQANTFERVAGMPKWFTLGAMVIWCVGLIFLAGFVKALEDVSFSEAMHNAGWAFIAGICAFVVGGLSLVFVGVKRKRAMGTPAYFALKEKEAQLTRECGEVLGVPSDAVIIDVIATRSKPGKNYNERSGFTMNVNLSVAVFKRDEALGFFVDDRVLYIPLSRIQSIQCIQKRVWVQGWNKPEPFNKGRYKAFKILRNNNGAIGAKPYYRIVVRDENYEEYVIVVPSYDAEFIVPLTGKTVE